MNLRQGDYVKYEGKFYWVKATGMLDRHAATLSSMKNANRFQAEVIWMVPVEDVLVVRR